MLSLLIYVSQGNAWGWTSGRQIALVAACLVLLAAFFRRALSVPEPIINLPLFRRPQLLYVALAGAVAYGVSACSFQVIPLLVMTPRIAGQTYGLGYSTTHYALLITPQQLAQVMCGVGVGYLASRGRNPRAYLTAGLLAWAVGMPMVAFWNDSVPQILLGSMVCGIGGGLTVAAVPNLVMRATPADDQGSTAGAVQLCQTGLSSVLPVIMFAVFAPYATVTAGGVLYAEKGFRIWMVAAAVLALVTVAVCSTLLRERRGRAVQEFSVDPVPAPATSW